MPEPTPTAEDRAARLAERLGGEPDPQPGELDGQAPPDTTGETPTQPAGKPPAAPPWGTDFDAQRAWETIQTQRSELRDLRAEKTKAEREKMTELERAQAERDEFRQKFEQAQLETLRNRIAMSKGLSADAAEFLTGTTQEELERNADKLARMITGGPNRTPDFGAGARPNGVNVEDDFNAILRRSAGRPA